MTQVPAPPGRSFSDRLRGLARREAGTEGAEANLHHLVAHQATAAVAISGADKSTWNGVNRQIEGGNLGAAWFDGTLDFDKAQVIDPLVELSRNNGRRQDPTTLRRFRNALQTMLHEHSHLLTPAHRQRHESAGSIDDPTRTALEEGVTEAWSATHVNEYIDALGAEEMAPGIRGTVTRQPYPQFAAAAQFLAHGIGQDAGLAGDEVLRRLNNEDADTKWPVAADLMFDSTNLPSVVPSEHHDLARNRIQQAMQAQFGHLADLQGTPNDLRLAAAAAGQSAVSAGRAEVAALHQLYRPPQPEQLVHRQEQAIPSERLAPGRNGSAGPSAGPAGPQPGLQPGPQPGPATGPATRPGTSRQTALAADLPADIRQAAAAAWRGSTAPGSIGRDSTGPGPTAPGSPGRDSAGRDSAELDSAGRGSAGRGSAGLGSSGGGSAGTAETTAGQPGKTSPGTPASTSPAKRRPHCPTAPERDR